MKQLNVVPASKAKLSSALISPVRCRQAADLIRGKDLGYADRVLSLEKPKAAKILLKLLRSAMANAQQKGVADLDRLYVSDLQVNEGPRIKRFMPRAHGRADKRLTRTSHILLSLAERAAKSQVTKKAKGTKAKAAKAGDK
jgi:large subunit ribosomal protein L22